MDEAANFACVVSQCETIGDRVSPGPRPRCPEQEPAEGETCETEALECSYGRTLASYCRRDVKCTDGVWTVPANWVARCQKQPSHHCGSQPQPGGACTTSEVDAFVPCEFSGGIVCYCFGNPVGVSGRPSQWECYGPPRNGACPEALPNIGEGCGNNGQSCHYGVSQQGCHAPYADVYCYQGSWEPGSAVCLL